MAGERESGRRAPRAGGGPLLGRWRRGGLPPGLALPLLAVSRGYGAAMGLRRELYRRGILRSRSLPGPVISVGNLTVGGTGKTPVALLLAETLSRRGRKVVILTRGYGARRRGKRPPFRAQDLLEEPSAVVGIGDEPVLLARRLPQVPVVVDADRYRGGLWAREQGAADLFILDDGFQHLALKRALDLVLVDGLNPFGDGTLFPRGILREAPRALERAGGILVTRANLCPRLSDLRRRLESLAPGVPVFEVDYAAEALVEVGGGRELSVGALEGVPVLAFSGLADPASFVSLLGTIGARLLVHRDFGDHHWYTAGELSVLEEEARSRGARFLICTEKDGVRLADLRIPRDPACLMLRLALRVRPTEDFWSLVERRVRVP